MCFSREPLDIHVVFPVLMCCCLCSSRTACFFFHVRSWWCPDVTLGRQCTFAQCRAEGLRGRLTRSLLGRVAISSAPFAVSTCRWVAFASDWFESSWSKRHMLTRAGLQDSDRHRRYVRRPLTMPTQEYLVSTRFVLTSVVLGLS